ncbi:RmlC-like cupin domain-containing protein [Lipomyces chichibuensis]|uniref:RmlC-like cupin domain-containing protein n=1 Tax=Lipomyces chichibuensis TaxID=1546026 RepID=UPI0033430456
MIILSHSRLTGPGHIPRVSCLQVYWRFKWLMSLSLSQSGLTIAFSCRTRVSNNLLFSVIGPRKTPLAPAIVRTNVVHPAFRMQAMMSTSSHSQIAAEPTVSRIITPIITAAAARGIATPQPVDTFDELVEEIRRQLGPTSGIDSDDVNVEQLMDAMRRYTSDSSDWDKYAHTDLSRNYTRNGVDDMNYKANLLILVWNPGKGSLIHDHADAHCIMKILQGELVESIYKWPQGDMPRRMQVERRVEYHENEVTYMHDKIGLHRISNETEKPAVSLHLYTPSWAAKYGCLAFDERTGKQIKVKLSNLYSDKGVKCSRRADHV